MFPQTVRQRDYIFNCLGARRDGSVDVEEEIRRGRNLLKSAGFGNRGKFQRP